MIWLKPLNHRFMSANGWIARRRQLAENESDISAWGLKSNMNIPRETSNDHGR
jgi:hypothetical protein